jgi:hypothetical protein
MTFAHLIVGERLLRIARLMRRDLRGLRPAAALLPQLFSR